MERERDDDETVVSGPAAFGAAPAASPLPASLGGYRIVGRLGEGGMGVVFEAEQQSPRRPVALKVVRGGQFVDETRLRMFQREAETLARLDHPNIAAIYESGRTPDGQHFFAMELVRGSTLDAWLRERGPIVRERDLRERVGLFREICDAVNYAHLRGVIHRDLKPSNIVVTAGAGGPQVKILDFGLARITDGDLAAPTLLTEVGVIKGTLAYMSPEQARGDPAAIDLRSDVYALGVVLYEMLAGRRPHALDRSSLVEAVRMVCEQPVPALERTEGGALRIEADLRTIVHKCLEKEPDRRYSSAAALSDDLARYLQSQPILARPPSTIYQLRKLVARHRALFGLAAALLVLIVGSGLWMALLYARASRAEARAASNFQLAREAVDRYFTRVSESPELRNAGFEDLRRQLLGTAREFYATLAAQPAGGAGIREELGATLLRLGEIERVMGDHEAAEATFREGARLAEDLGRASSGSRGPRVNHATMLGALALVYADTGRIDESLETYTRAIGVEETLAAESPGDADGIARLANLLSNLGILHERRAAPEPAEAAYRRATELRRQLARARPDDTGARRSVAQSLVNLGALYARTGRLAEAEPLLAESIPLAEALVAEQPDDPEALNLLGAASGNLAGVYVLSGRLDEAGTIYLRELEARERLSERHPAVLEYRLFLGSALTNLGELETRRSRHAEALPWFERAASSLARVLELEPRHATARYYLSYTFGWWARALEGLGRRREAAERYGRAIELDDTGDASLREGLARATERTNG